MNIYWRANVGNTIEGKLNIRNSMIRRFNIFFIDRPFENSSSSASSSSKQTRA